MQKYKRTYSTKYETRTRDFITSLDNTLLIKDIANLLEIDYRSLHYIFKVDRISHKIMYKILGAFSLDDNQKQVLKSLLKVEK